MLLKHISTLVDLFINRTQNNFLSRSKNRIIFHLPTLKFQEKKNKEITYLPT